MVGRPKSSSVSSTSAPETLRLSRSPPLGSSPLTKEVPLPGVPTGNDEVDEMNDELKTSSKPHPELPGSRRRGLSISAIQPAHAYSSIHMSRIVSNPLPPKLTTSSSASPGVGAVLSTRSRSSSTSRGRTPLRESIFTWRTRSPRSETPPNGAPRAWWGFSVTDARPWNGAEKRRLVPPEQAEGWARTQKVSC